MHCKNVMRNEGNLTRAAGGEREGSPQEGAKGGRGISWVGGEGVVRCATQAEVRGEEEEGKGRPQGGRRRIEEWGGKRNEGGVVRR